MKKYTKIICMAAAVCLLGAAAFCGFRIYSHYAHESEQEEVFEKIAEVVEQAQTGESETVDVLLTEEETVLAEYGELYLQNTDMVGWLSIAGTNINYPVMQTPNNPNYYLKHNFENEYSDLGTPYVQENCDLLTSDNLVIYGHHIKGQKMFGALENYKSKDFYEEHETIRFDTLTKRGEYEIVAVFKTVAYSSAGFRYYDFVDTEDENAFNAYITKCKELALYDTGVTAEYGDRLITLSTCEYSAQNGRLVVVAKKVAYTSPSRAKELCKYELTQTLIDYRYSLLLNKQGYDIKAHIKIDTGMHRLGFSTEDKDKILAAFSLKHIKVAGIFTHLCAADSLEENDVAFTNKQIGSFYKVLDWLKSSGLNIPKVHIQSSYGLLNYPELECDYIRVGVALYGVLSSTNDKTKFVAGTKRVCAYCVRPYKALL